MDYKNADEKALRENLKNRIHELLTEGYQDKQPRTQPKGEYDAWLTRVSASKKAEAENKRKKAGEEGDSEKSEESGEKGKSKKSTAIDYYAYKHGKGNFPVMNNESKVRLSASEFQKFITESVKRTINRMLTEHQIWEPYGSPDNVPLKEFLVDTEVPDSWNEPDMIDKNDFFDMIKSSDERERENFVDFVKEQLSDEYENGVSSTAEFLKQVSAGKNPFMAAIDLGVKWEDIALEFFDIKPVSFYPADREQ
jgi:hypothetical protein